jgi:hypothetical protein
MILAAGILKQEEAAGHYSKMNTTKSCLATRFQKGKT